MNIDNKKNKLIKKLQVYIDNFSKEQLYEYESSIFTDEVSRKKRAELELIRLKLDIDKLNSVDSSVYEEYLDLFKLLQVADFDPSVIDNIYARVVRLQLENDLSIRLYTALSLLQDQLEMKLTLTKNPEAKKVI